MLGRYTTGPVAARAEHSRGDPGLSSSAAHRRDRSYTRAPCHGSTCAATPSPTRPRPCAGRWPTPRSATTSSATTRRSSPSRSAPPSCSARRPACSSPPARWATSSPRWPTSARGQETIAGREHHIVIDEAAGHAVIVGASIRALEDRPDGTHRPGRDRGRLPRPDRPARADHRPDHAREHPRPFDGPAADARRTPARSATIAHAHGVPLHIDGARFWNAVVALRRAPARDLADPADTVTFCLSQGRSPARSARSSSGRARSSGARDARARWSVAGCARSASSPRPASSPCSDGPDGMIDRLAEDHANARRLAEALAEIDGIVSRRWDRPARRPARSTRARPHELRPVQGRARPGRVPRRAPSARRRDGGISPRAGPRRDPLRGDRRRHRDRHRRHAGRPGRDQRPARWSASRTDAARPRATASRSPPDHADTRADRRRAGGPTQ